MRMNKTTVGVDWNWPPDLSALVFRFVWRKTYATGNYMFDEHSGPGSSVCRSIRRHKVVNDQKTLFIYDGPCGEERLRRAISLEDQVYYLHDLVRGDIAFFTGDRGEEKLTRIYSPCTNIEFNYIGTRLRPLLSHASFPPQAFLQHDGQFEWQTRLYEEHQDGTLVVYEPDSSDANTVSKPTTRKCKIFLPGETGQMVEVGNPYNDPDWYSTMTANIIMNYQKLQITFPNGRIVYLDPYKWMDEYSKQQMIANYHP
jgi:hypothetical protein